MATKWIPVKSYSDLPEGTWLVWFSEPSHGTHFGIAKVQRGANALIPVIDGLFGWDALDVVAYTTITADDYKA